MKGLGVRVGDPAPVSADTATLVPAAAAFPFASDTLIITLPEPEWAMDNPLPLPVKPPLALTNDIAAALVDMTITCEALIASVLVLQLAPLQVMPLNV